MCDIYAGGRPTRHWVHCAGMKLTIRRAGSKHCGFCRFDNFFETYDITSQALSEKHTEKYYRLSSLAECGHCFALETCKDPERRTSWCWNKM